MALLVRSGEQVHPIQQADVKQFQRVGGSLDVPGPPVDRRRLGGWTPSSELPQSEIEDSIRGLLNRTEFWEPWDEVFADYGERALPLLERIAADPTTGSIRFGNLMGSRLVVKRHPHRFMPYAIKRAADGDVRIQHTVFFFLARQDVDPSVLPLLVSGLYSEDYIVVYKVAEAIADKFGTRNELVVFDLWLQQHRDKPDPAKTFEAVMAARNRLADRLDRK